MAPIEPVMTTLLAPQRAGLDEQPAYRMAADGRFLPANAAAHEECRRWNAYADAWNTYTATRSLP